MRIDRKRLVLGVAIAGALSLLIAGCGKNPEEQAAQPATTSQAPTTPESATTTEASGAAQPASTARAADQTSTAEAEDTAKPATTSVGTTIDDSVITAKVKAALLADPDIKSFDIAVETHKGEVQLSGFVDNQKQIDQAIEIAKNVDGVTNVGNAMSIKK